MRVPFSIMILAPFLACCTAANAQNLSDEDDLALVYGGKTNFSLATGSAQSLRRAPSVATVITAQEIAAMGAIDLDEVLEAVPGLHVSRSPVRYAPAYYMRGMVGSGLTTPQILMLHNDIPMTTSFNGDNGADWQNVPVSNIARIEIIRGPGSALYGADAYAGVINVITKTASEVGGTRAGVQSGSMQTHSTWLEHGGRWGDLDVAAYLRAGKTGGIDKIIEADAQTRYDRLFGTHASLAPGPVSAGHEALDASLKLTRGRWQAHAMYRLRDQMHTGVGVGSALDPNSVGRSERFVGDIAWRDTSIAPHWDVALDAAYSHYSHTYANNFLLLPPGASLPGGSFPEGMVGGPNMWERQFRLSGTASYNGFAAHKVRLGLGHDDIDMYRNQTIKNYWLNDKGVPIPTGPVIDYSAIQPHILPQRRKINYLYIQDEWQLATDWTLTAGLRHDHYSDFGGTSNPRLALVWDASLNLTAKLLYGHAFRPPSFNEQYGFNAIVSGNPSVQPERIKTLEAAINWQAHDDLQVGLNVFHYDMRDLIRMVPNMAPATGATYQNIGAQRGNGFELEATWDLSRSFRLSGHYAYQRAIDLASQQDAGYAPHHHVYARADWRLSSGWQASGQINHVADRHRHASDLRQPVADYTTFDLTLRSPRSRNGWEWSLTARNLFNADVREPSPEPWLAIPGDLPMAGRAIYLTVSCAI